jgi:hypothetical protein
MGFVEVATQWIGLCQMPTQDIEFEFLGPPVLIEDSASSLIGLVCSRQWAGAGVNSWQG